MLVYLTHTARRLKDALLCERGALNPWAVIGCALVLVAYLVNPDPFYNFFHFLFDWVFDALHDSFGTEADPKEPGAKGK